MTVRVDLAARNAVEKKRRLVERIRGVGKGPE
jgi:hypothetical protein